MHRNPLTIRKAEYQEEKSYEMQRDKLYSEEGETYFRWFLHYYEKVMGYVQRFDMQGHFSDLKQAYVMGMMKVLKKHDISRGVPFIIYKEHYAENEVYEFRSLYLCRKQTIMVLFHWQTQNASL